MPLLRKQLFEKQEAPVFLRDEEEVFYCEITNEIFREYHDFSERMFLCNSMVWTCALTGKSNLTYEEAVQSEQDALRSLKEFTSDLNLPILYLSTLTKRTSFGEMAEDIFMYVKDRYFVGENVEGCFANNKWKDCHVISVIAPDETVYKHEIKENCNKSPSERSFIPSASLYKYEIEHTDANDADVSEMMIVDSSQIRRKKQSFSREKCKLFLKQNVEQDSRGIFVIKKDVIEKHNVTSVMWETIFDGPLPDFQSSKKFDKALNGKKKHKQVTMAKYLEKNGLAMKKPENKAKSIEFLEQMKKREEEFKIQKQLNEERKAQEKLKKKEEHLQLTKYLKDWSKVKEDLELEDHAKLPEPIPIKTKVPDQYFGEMLMILEFVQNFQKILCTKNFFPDGINLEILERALMQTEVAGPFIDLVQMFLSAIFDCLDEESKHCNIGIETLKTTVDRYTDSAEDIVQKLDGGPPNLEQATVLATIAAHFPLKFQGLPLTRLPLFALTVSEVLRLHLLASGARIRDSGWRWRYAQRGGFTCEDDPGLYMRVKHSHIIKSLEVYNVVQLPLADKIEILSCLMNQILGYADVRDIVEENFEEVRTLKQQLRIARISEKKAEADFLAKNQALKKEMSGNREGLKVALEKYKVAFEKKQAVIRAKIQKLSKSVNEGQVVLGRDRAFRTYLKIDSVPGLFVMWDGAMAGTCLEKATIQYPGVSGASRPDLLKHIKNLYEKPLPNENHSNVSVKTEGSPKKMNGTVNSLTEPDPVDYETYSNLLLCTSDISRCPVHTDNPINPRWAFFYRKEHLEALIEALNKRGLREKELKEMLKEEEDTLLELMEKTPVAVLNPEAAIKLEPEGIKETRHNGSKKKDRYEDANLGYPNEMSLNEVLENALIDTILEMEEKLSAGALGTLPVKDREHWRNCLQNKNYLEFGNIQKINTGEMENKHLKIKKRRDSDRSRSSTPEIPEKKEYQDPGKFLGTIKEEVPSQTESVQLAIKSLATALGHIADAVEYKFLKRPLGSCDLKANVKQKEKYDVLESWQQSLSASTSFSQVFLHYGTLDSCIVWSKSALLARCRICRRQNDSENMLLCDSCNLGHHLYCLKPKLTAVPKGDWFCDRCKKEKEEQEKLLSPEPVKKRRRIFVEEEEEEDEGDSGNEDINEDEDICVEECSDNDEDVDEEKLELCKTCGGDGETVHCDKCECNFHKDCVEPPLRRLPRSSWTCPSCTISKSRPQSNGTREKRKRGEENGYGTGGSDEEEVVKKRVMRRDEKRDDLPLHNSALQQLLTDVMKNDNAWPFLRPVQQKEVPDYYEIIKEPMDFGTIKYNLNMGKYSADSQIMKDMALIFDNCNTYNSSTDEVYKCGVSLMEYLSKRAKELGLTVPPELEDESLDKISRPSKKRRTK
ncbi:bromodomain adjacent to zinc finger domain protein 1A isoform X2 [Anthonomus grandis grandis]|uniref:bromodomain adjacent to zinc finger domain protein 1A isoform X2 n=1 Tax=Anthonomus grandis grandis TaxID=2921223 RepID=UPI0021650F81|nr:bromodomain adjacent to zinc finger domain protein 1A isoform X2 [Anthonomus grandis grandis]